MTGPASSSRSQASGSSTAGATPSGCPQTLCGFWLGDERFAVDVALVAEVVHLEQVTEVPQSHTAIRGIFNLRGVPVALIEPSRLLELSHEEAAARTSAVVLRRGTLTAGFAVDRVDAVIQAAAARFVPAQQGKEQELVLGFLEPQAPGERTVTVLGSDAVVARLESLRFSAS